MTGRIVQLYVSSANVYVELDLPEEERPLKGFFRMSYRYPDPNLPYTNLIFAAAGAHRVEIATRDPITPDRYGEIVNVATRLDPAP